MQAYPLGAVWNGRKKQPTAVVPVPPRQASVDEDGESDGDDERDDDEQLIAALPKKFQPFARTLLARVVEGDARIAALEDTVRTLKRKAVLYRYEVDGSNDGSNDRDDATGQDDDANSQVNIAVLPDAEEEDEEDEEEVDELLEGPSTSTVARPQKRKSLPHPSSCFN